MQPILAEKTSWTAMDYANINFGSRSATPSASSSRAASSTRSGSSAFFPRRVALSLATGAHGLATSAAGFVICRFILGPTEAANYPPA